MALTPASSIDRVRAALARAEQLQPTVAAFELLTPELALAAAERAAPGPLHGWPLAVKDVIDVAGVPTRLGTPGAGHHVPAATAAVVERAVAAGAVPIGKAHTHELALGMVTPQTRNPLDTSRVVGGSSGGSAAAVAAGIVPIALGTDTNGSIRCPAALCGVVGLRPTQGGIVRDGVATLAWTQDTVGLLAIDARACRAFYDALTDAPAAAPPAQRLRLGVDRAAIAAAEPGVARACAQTLEALAREGVELVDASLPDPALAGSVAAVVLYAEAAAAWQVELEAQPEGFSAVARAALRAGAGVSASDYLRAKRARALVCARVREEFERLALTAVAMPTVPVTAAPAGARTVESGGRRRAIDAVHSRFTALASVTGQPALSVPCGLGEEGLPVGLQLVGPPHSERMLLDLAATVERTDGAGLVAAARSTAARTSSFV